YIEDNEFGGIDSATLRKFKKEEFKTEAVIDLHGLTEDVAFEKVDEFIPRCYAQGKRCIIIITGKGSAHKDEDIFAVKGVLRKSVPQWLNMPRLRSMILVYKHPSERLGGSGALYILLKRNKEI
ncbi:MAG: Smr/MutS family protein, partial [Alphaproteobacteria bacterium]|nr:Smr/MutS family protein [Alphaproteobacteria bacterium]